jgi:hypothetical protein
MSIHRSSAGEMGFGAMSTADRRAAVQREEHDRALMRQEQLASQRSPLNNPQERMRIWERLHSLSLPRSQTHKLVRMIAEATDLTVLQVQEEQRRRAERAGSAGGNDADPMKTPEILR